MRHHRLFPAVVLAAVLSLGSLAACEEEGPAEQLGERVGETGEEAGEALEGAGEAVEEQAD